MPDRSATPSSIRCSIHLETRFLDAAELLGNARDDLLAFTVFRKAVWRQIWSNNPLERLKKFAVAPTWWASSRIGRL